MCGLSPQWPELLLLTLKQLFAHPPKLLLRETLVFAVLLLLLLIIAFGLLCVS
jgi:hypothetical protein